MAEEAVPDSAAVSVTRVPIIRVDEVYNKKQRKKVFVQSADRTKAKISSKYVLVVRRVIEGGPPFRTILDIRGRGSLLKVLMDFFKDAAGMRLSENPPNIEPNLLYHAMTEIRQRKKEEEAILLKEKRDENLIFELDAALTFLNEEFALEQTRIEGLKQNNEITFDSLWAILPPNELLFRVDSLSEPCVFRLLYHYEVHKERSTEVYIEIVCNSVDYNGKVFGTTFPTTMKIMDFPGSKKIAELEVFPLQFHPKRERIRQSLIERGQKRNHIQQGRLNNYKGHGLIEVEKEVPNPRSSIFNSEIAMLKENVNFHGRVIIDHAVYDQIVPKNRMVSKIQSAIPEELTEDQILMLPSILYGFSLGDKIWGGFAVSRLSNVEWDDTVWESLVLPATEKALIRTLVKSHSRNNNGFDDFVKEKGKGLVGLFTGSPGVGKTLTAEAIAEDARKPLYMLSSGELGDQPGLMDTKLKQIMELTEIWGAVLLIDEADVFLSQRDQTSLTRNACVSIFLRQLEYYQGILILTTNRKEHIDEAFKSRVHFCHHYEGLDKDARMSIWQSFLQKAKANPSIEVSIDEKGYDDLSSMPLNGRQIKNAMKMAQSMATEEQAPITVQSIKIVAASLQNFGF